MATVDMYNNFDSALSLAPAARTASANGTGVNLAGYSGALVVVTTGAITDGTHTIEVQESADDSAYTAVAAANLQGTEPAIVAANDNVVYKLGYLGQMQYIRVIVTVATATTGGVYGASVVRGYARKSPV